MRVLYVMVNVVVIILHANCDINLEDNEAALPPIFYIERNYEKCKSDGKLFCKVSVILTPTDSKNSSYYWEVIEESINNKRAYNHNELFHVICVNDFCPGLAIVQEDVHLKNILSICYSKKYGFLGLTANVTHLNCTDNDLEYKAGIFDLTWLYLIITYTSYIIIASFWDYQYRYKNNCSDFLSTNIGKNLLIPFSLINNWQKLKRENSNPEFQKLKCIQGIRFYNMLLIIFCHTYSSFIGGYVKNTSYIENIPKNPIKLGIRNLLVFLVQTFFLISSFLLSYHVFQIIERTKMFNKKYIFLTFLNRYLRIIPPVLVMIGLGSTIWMVSVFHGPIKDLYSDLEYQRCQKNWWTTLLFINNHYNQHDMCYFITWYLAADTQLYVMSLVILSIIWKLKNRTKLVLALCVIIGIIIPAAISYIYNLDIIYRIIPENAKNNKFRSFNFNAIYSSTYANMATYMVGLCMGYIYSKKNNVAVFKKLLYRLFWWIGFLGVPTLVITITSYDYTRFYSAVLCGLLKPMYALGIGIGILGMSQDIGGIVKSICEWRPAVYLGNLTYSTYVVHYGIVFYRTATAKEPLYISDYVLITSFIKDALLSFLCGFIMHIMVEMPTLQLQNLLVPQVRSKRTSSFNSKKE